MYCQTSRSSQCKASSKAYLKNTASNSRRCSNTEHQRLEAQAERLRELMGNKIIHAPLDVHSVKKIVETGCGTGIKTDEFGATFPRASVYGVDLPPVPAVRPKREIIEYIQGDILHLADLGSDEQLAKNSFDYVFSRTLMAGMTKWEEYFQLCVALVKPGVS
jgi:trans-aconitate methyltransferase